jgi:hypothetical protein
LHYYNKIPETPIYKGERFILAHSFGGFSPWLVGEVAFGPVLGSTSQLTIHSMVTRSKKEEAGGPES